MIRFELDKLFELKLILEFFVLYSESKQLKKITLNSIMMLECVKAPHKLQS